LFLFITKKPFWFNFLAALFLVVLMGLAFLQLLGMITNHGQYLTVPSVVGLNTNDAIKQLEKQGFDVVIQDSVYTDTLQRGVVMKQLPDPNSTVKVNRTIYLTVNRFILPMIEMPTLEGKTIGFALEILKRSHLELGDTIFKPDFMKGSVLEQLYNGKRIKLDEKLPWGSRISLVIGSGLSGEQIRVPSLVGLSFAEAQIILDQFGLSVGALVVDPGVTDTAASFVYKQSPEKYNEEKEPIYIQSGQWMDIWLSKERIVADSIDSNQ